MEPNAKLIAILFLEAEYAYSREFDYSSIQGLL